MTITTHAHRETFPGVRMLALTPISAYGGFNTSRHRVEAFRSLGCTVEVIDTTSAENSRAFLWARTIRAWLFKLGWPVYAAIDGGVRARINATPASNDYELIWLEKAVELDDTDLGWLRGNFPNALLVGFSPDDMNARHNRSEQFSRALHCYDLFVTTKSYNVGELKALGAPDVLFVGNGFDPAAFNPKPVAEAERHRLGGDVGFIGSFEEPRARSMFNLARNGINVRIWGNGWQNCPYSHPRMKVEQKALFGEDFSRACCSFKINLGFLRKLNRDLQTTRSVEIPGCGGFMLAERTDEHLALFEEGVEAEYFSTDDELLEKCRQYLECDEARMKVAQAGFDRCMRSDYTNLGRMRAVLKYLVRTRPRSMPGPFAGVGR